MSDIKGEVKLVDLHNNQEACLWSLLPSETLKEIFSFISDDYLRHLRLVNRQWFNIINLNNFTIGLVRKDEFPELIQTFSRYSTLLNLTFTKTNLINKCIDELTRLTQLQSLVFRRLSIGWFRRDYFSSLPNLRSLEVHSLTADALAYLTQLTRLRVSCIRALMFQGDLDEGPMPLMVHLKELNLERCAAVDNTKKFLANCTNLKRLKMRYVETKGNDFELSLHHLTQLEAIHMDRNVTLSGLSVDTITCLKSESQSLISSGILQQLTNLKILLGYKVPPNIAMMTKLELLDLANIRKNDIEQLPLSVKSLKNNSDYIDFSELTRLTYLEELKVMCQKIPDFLPFMEMKHLTALEVSFDKLEDVQSVTVLTALRDLDLFFQDEEKSFNSYDEISFTSLRHLTSLKTSTGCKIINVSNMTQLQVLVSRAEQITGLETCTGLTWLVAPISPKKFCSLANLTLLRQLNPEEDIDEPEFVSEKDLMYINSVHLTSLARLNIASNAIMGLTRLSKLQYLWLPVPMKEVEDLPRHFSCLVNLATNDSDWDPDSGWTMEEDE